MANEIQIIHDDAAETVYAIVRNQAGQWYVGAAPETYESSHWATYAIALSVVDSSSPPATGNVALQGTFPAVTPGFYWLDTYIRGGATAAQTDARLDRRLVYWNGSSLAGHRDLPPAPGGVASGVHVKPGATDVSIYFYLTGAATGQAYTTTSGVTSLKLAYQRPGEQQVSSQVTSALAAADSAHADNHVFHCGGGLWRCDLPDAAFAAGADRAVLMVTHDDADILPASVGVEFWTAKVLRAALAVLAGNMTFDEATGQTSFLDAEDASAERASYTVSATSVGRSDAGIH
jgi:hypothetical protein